MSRILRTGGASIAYYDIYFIYCRLQVPKRAPSCRRVTAAVERLGEEKDVEEVFSLGGVCRILIIIIFSGNNINAYI